RSPNLSTSDPTYPHFSPHLSTLGPLYRPMAPLPSVLCTTMSSCKRAVRTRAGYRALRYNSSRGGLAMHHTADADAVPVRQPGVFTILVVGSINMDLVARCPHIPAPGETILGSDFTQSAGGKGANGATAAARLLSARMGGRVAMLGAVGRDDHGAALVRNLGARGVDAQRVLRLDGVPTGVALIAVADDGENSIVVVPGA